VQINLDGTLVVSGDILLERERERKYEWYYKMFIRRKVCNG
jgi:hypothetical protein